MAIIMTFQQRPKPIYPPYGIDFPQGATGRFCNGRTTTDILGVDYASIASGIRNETGQNLGERISMVGQLQHHQITVSRINEIIRDKNLAIEPQFYPSSRLFTPEQHAIALNQELSQQLTVVTTLFGITPIGCAPAILAAAGTNGSSSSSSSCGDRVNNAVQLFNTGLRSLVDGLSNNLTGANFIYVNTYQIYSTSSSGFRVRNAPCCPASPITALCIPSSNPRCSGSEYTWWDAIHPSETSNIITATGSYNSQSPFDTYGPLRQQKHFQDESFEGFREIIHASSSIFR
ncbi:hypothetical protein Peur_043766 [Populus x canadensis]